MPPCDSFMPWSEPSSHPTAMVASSRDTAMALIGDFGFLSLGHLCRTQLCWGKVGERGCHCDAGV
ncbi:unnamed protein product [Ectocarpus sp. CCAP 1310/34]|nr:unnamed protein product [Ectocarpus sp. CCAP 1310/34]